MFQQDMQILIVPQQLICDAAHPVYWLLWSETEWEADSKEKRKQGLQAAQAFLDLKVTRVTQESKPQ